MKHIKVIIFLSFSFCFCNLSFSQEDSLMLELEKEMEPKTQYAPATFKATRVINGQSVENPGPGILQFLIQHRFGTLNSGAYNLFGLDESTVRIGFDYGIGDKLALGIGRSSFGKVYDGYIKYKLLRQSTGEKKMPLTVVLYTNTSISTIEKSTDDKDIALVDRLSFSHQILIARKFSERLSFQISPSYVHRNVVPTKAFQNDVFAVGMGGRLKISKRTSINAEYFYLLPGHTDDNFYNSFSIGFDIETGGHVFQLHVTNSQGMTEPQFIAQTTGNFWDGDIHYGFNISRAFSVGNKNKMNASS